MFLFQIILIFLLNIDFSFNEKLIFVQTLCRHGARAPLKLKNGTDCLGIKWDTPGELTPVGKRMEYLLGLVNRNRYITGKYKFLSDKYNPHELQIYSSDVNRTLESMTSQIQGLYPASSERGDKLTPDQYNVTFPPLNINIEDIENETKLLNDSALPNYMTIIPIHFITLKNTTTECANRVKELNIKNEKEISTLKNFVEEFNKNYSEKLNDFYGVQKDNKFEFSFIGAIFDTAVVDITEGKNISEYFEKNQINEKDFLSWKYEVLAMNFRDYVFGDDNNEVILFYNTPLLKQLINNMQRRIEDDINGEPSLDNVTDYSRPKMVMVSGHDTTLSAQEMFFIKFFDLDLKSYTFPTYSSQISYAITREDDDYYFDSVKTFSDYNVSYYLNDKLLLSIPFDKFKEKIEKVLWHQEQMDSFCFGKKEGDNFEFGMFLVIIMGFVILVLVIIIIILMTKLARRKGDPMNLESFIKNEKIVNDDD